MANAANPISAQTMASCIFIEIFFTWNIVPDIKESRVRVSDKHRNARAYFGIILPSCERAAADTKVLPPPQAG